MPFRGLLISSKLAVLFLFIVYFHSNAFFNQVSEWRDRRTEKYTRKLSFKPNLATNSTITFPPAGSLSHHLLTDAVPSSMLQGNDSGPKGGVTSPSAEMERKTGLGSMSVEAAYSGRPREMLHRLTDPAHLVLMGPASGKESIPSHFGDIMGGTNTAWEAFPEFSAMERILLTANGNLQRIISSFYNAPVSVKIVRNRRLGDWVYDREVNLIVHSKIFCVASSKVVIHSKECMEVISNDKVGIGQLFRHFDVLPRFQLLTAGRTQNGFYRLYDLTSQHLSCRILEEFPNDIFNL